MRFRMSRLRPYGLAVAASIAVQCLKLLVGPVLLPGVFPLSFAAMLVSTWYGGFGPGVVASVLCGLWATALFLPPPADDWLSVVRGMAFVGTATLLSWALDRSRKVMEKAHVALEVRESEERYRELVENLNDIIFSLDASGTISYISPVVEELSGYRPDEVTGHSFAEFIHADDIGLAWESLQRTFQGVLEPLDFRLVAKDGSVLWVRSSSRAIFAGESLVGVRGVIRDMTDRRRAEEDLRESEERFRKIFDEGPLGMAVVGTDNRFLRVNNTLCQIAGYSESELVGRTFADISHPEDLDIERNYAQQLLSRKIPGYQLEKRCIRRDGQMVWVSWSASLIRNGQGTPLYGIAMIQNINDRKRAEAEAHERQAELAHVLRVATMNEMGTTLAHELNQPLAAITNFAKGCVVRLRSGNVVADELAGVQEEIAAQAERAALVIRRLRAFVRREPPRREWLDLNQLIREAVSFLTAEVRACGIVLELELAAGLPPVHVDRVQVEQVILNLIRNGLDALGGSEAGCRELSIRTAIATDGALEVAVCDTGSGLPSAAADLVFTPFFTTKPDGLGMGLSISRLIVEAHGGRLWATPQPDRGATFKFKLPADCIGLADGD